MNNQLTLEEKLESLGEDHVFDLANRLFTNSQMCRCMNDDGTIDQKKLRDAVTKRLKYAPDDTGREWKHPFLWNHEEIHQQALEEMGCDDIAVRGFNVLVKLWIPNEITASGSRLSEIERRKEMQQCRIGKVLRMGNEAFTDKVRFPFGHRITYGEWASFRGMERDIYKKNGVFLASIHDDRFIISDKTPESLQTSFELERDNFGQ